jgi:SnoaL-like domain
MTVEERLARLEAVHQIHNLIAQFARGADDGCNPEILRPIFTDDAVFDIGQFGRLEGGDVIARSMHENMDKGFRWTLHYLTSPHIQIDASGHHADVFFYLWEVARAAQKPEGKNAYWIGGWYDARAMITRQGWRFAFLKLTVGLMTPHTPGWGDVPKSFDAI